ncbi:MAG: hypothetical protein CSB55_04940 [Candidatus Cloacimonadota bacterium]|nr:MAG: hypothetical protein CSB55_04940 [Candidatus Cloacimonadota bacterium]
MLNNSGKANIFIIMGIVVANLILSYLLFTFVIAEKMIPASPQVEDIEKESSSESDSKDNKKEKEKETKKKKSKKSKSKKKKPKKKKDKKEYAESGEDSNLNLEAKDYFKEFSIFNLEDIVVNPQSADGHFLVVKMGFEYHLSDKKLPDELKNKVILITDNISFYLSSQSLGDLSKIQYRSVLKDEIKSMVNQVLTEGEITNVLFAQYIIQ